MRSEEHRERKRRRRAAVRRQRALNAVRLHLPSAKRAAIGLLAVGFVATFVGLLVVGWTASLRRTESAPARITAQTQALTAPDKTAPRLVVEIWYSFQVDGLTYQGVAKRGRTASTDAKVCYEPGDPQGNHALEGITFTCGLFDGANPGDR